MEAPASASQLSKPLSSPALGRISPALVQPTAAEVGAVIARQQDSTHSWGGFMDFLGLHPEPDAARVHDYARDLRILWDYEMGTVIKPDLGHHHHWSRKIKWRQLEAMMGEETTEVVECLKRAYLIETYSGEHSSSNYITAAFEGDHKLERMADSWLAEESLHGEVIKRWLFMVDPEFDIWSATYMHEFWMDLDKEFMPQRSLAEELVARAKAEIGVAAFYRSLEQRAKLPFTQHMLARLAHDEDRHYAMFTTHLKRLGEDGKAQKLERLKRFVDKFLSGRDPMMLFTLAETILGFESYNADLSNAKNEAQGGSQHQNLHGHMEAFLSHKRNTHAMHQTQV